MSSEGKQVYDDVVYTVVFGVKGVKDEKSVVFNRGWVNLCGMKVGVETRLLGK